MIILYAMFSRVPTCTSYSSTLNGENSGRLKRILYFSFVETVSAAVVQVAAASFRNRSFDTKSLLTCVLVEPESNKILILVVLGFPSVVWMRPKVIGA